VPAVWQGIQLNQANDDSSKPKGIVILNKTCIDYSEIAWFERSTDYVYDQWERAMGGIQHARESRGCASWNDLNLCGRWRKRFQIFRLSEAYHA